MDFFEAFDVMRGGGTVKRKKHHPLALPIKIKTITDAWGIREKRILQEHPKSSKYYYHVTFYEPHYEDLVANDWYIIDKPTKIIKRKITSSFEEALKLMEQGKRCVPIYEKERGDYYYFGIDEVFGKSILHHLANWEAKYFHNKSFPTGFSYRKLTSKWIEKLCEGE